MRSAHRDRVAIWNALWIIVGLCLALANGHAQTSDIRPLVNGVDSIGITVSDMDRAIDFYSRVLTFEKTSEVEVYGAGFERLQGLFGLRMRVVRMRLGSESIELTEYLAPKGRPIPADMRSNDKAFQHIAIIVSDMDRAYARLRSNRVEHASTGPQRLPDWNKNAGGIRAFYFHDPDGHTLEILQFPNDKGSPKWHQSNPKLFMGIDHTAIVVTDTNASLKLYRDALGFEVAGESENYGEEQEHLNNVFGARLKITSLHAAQGPSIEFLEYLAPRDGRAFPYDTRASDLWNWQTKLTVSDSIAAGRAITEGKYKLISPGLVTLDQDTLGFRKGLTFRDPDGHAMQLIERDSVQTSDKKSNQLFANTK